MAKSFFSNVAPAIPLVGDVVGAIAQGAQNRKSRRFSREMYARQKADSLEFWNMQNQYNSPEAQMLRLKGAGLNPALVYGDGAVANSSSAPRTPSAMSAQFTAPRFNSGEILSAYNDTRLRDKQLDLLDAQVLKTLADASGGLFDLGVKSDVRDVTVQQAQEKLTEIQLTNEAKGMANKVSRQMIDSNVPLQKALLDVVYGELKNSRVRVDIDQVKTNIRRLEKDNVLKQLDIDLRRKGINPSDPIYLRILGRILTDVLGINGFTQ